MSGATSSKGLLRYATGDSGRNRFGTYFPPPGADPTGGPTKSLGSAIAGALINKLKSFIPSTNPFGFGGNANNKWEIRPEYKGTTGAYEAMYADKGGLLAIANTPPNAGSSSKGFVDTIVGSLKNAIFGKSPPAAAPISADARKVDFYHRYTPTTKYRIGQNNGRAVPASNANPLAGALNINIDTQIKVLENPSPPTDFNQFTYSTERLNSVKDSTGRLYKTYSKIGESYLGGNGKPNVTSIYEQSKFDEKIKAVESWDKNKDNIRSRPSVERLKEVKDYKTIPQTYMPYADIGKDTFSRKANNNKDLFLTYPTIDDPSNSKSGKNIIGGYDKYNTLTTLKNGSREEEPTELTDGPNQSKDLIFFYFYDLINNVHIPFRATLNSLSEANSVEWDPIQYLGRADKLYNYKGFERTLSFGFTVYANSLKELVPMWKRINYLVGLARPPKYTSPEGNTTSFMYPPMITFRLGDLYYDQPGVFTSIAVNIPDDAGLWEVKREKANTGNYMFYNGLGSDSFVAYQTPEQALQLPIKAAISVNMNLMEKGRSQTDVDHYNVTANV
jgi:hypothetical protein